jgi:hypothetical protein
MPPRDAFYTRRQGRFLRERSAENFPGQTVWKLLKYPGSFTFPIYLLALPDPFPEELIAPIETLHKEMIDDGVTHGNMETRYQQDHRQVHLWVAKLGMGKYLPVGQTLFLAEKRMADANLGGGFVSKWWLHYSWIKPAYRNQKIFQSSLDYFQAWHPHFTLRDTTPTLVSAFKKHPEHLRDESKTVRWI